MPPEPLPWDRKDFFRERKHNNGYDRVSEPLGGSVSRWRENPPHGSRNEFGRWGFPSDFRRPPGYGKQGSWNPYHEDFSHGYPPARSNDRFYQDGCGFRPSGPYRDGRYPRNFRESRASFSQKDWRGQTWDSNHHHGSASGGPGSLIDAKDQKSVDDSQTRLSQSHSDVANASNQLHTEEQPDALCEVNESSVGRGVEKANSLPSIDWKPLKWSRSGSMTSKSPVFGPSSSSRSAGEPCDVKIELPSSIATPDESSSGDAVGCIASPTSLDDTASRKKPRLGWGEGLAKYEKKKVDSPSDCQAKSPSLLCGSNSDLMQSPSLDLVDKSPRIGSFLDCRSPMTPSSVAYSSSPGMDDKSYMMKAVETDSDSNYMSPSPAPRSQVHSEGVAANLEIIQFKSTLDVSGLLSEVLQNEEQSLVDPGSIKMSTINKLISLKGDFLKALESTESEIDTLENELKSLKFERQSNSPCPESSSSMSIDCKEKPRDGLNMNQRPPALTVISSSDMDGEGMPGSNVIEEACLDVKGEIIDSPGTATSKFTEPSSSDKVPSPVHMKHGHVQNMIDLESARCEPCTSFHALKAEGSPASDGESKVPKDGDTLGHGNLAVFGTLEDDALDSIIAFNKETALKASQIFDNLLPCSSCVGSVEAISSRVSSACGQNSSLIKEKFLKIKQSVRFKERALSLKYKAFHYLWKEDLQLLSQRKFRPKAQKKVESSLRLSHSGFLKQHRSSVRPQSASQACTMSLFPASEVVGFTNKLLSSPQILCYRNDLRMPALILDKKEKLLSKFVSNNGLVKDPCAVERERPLVNPWTAEEKEIFMDKLAAFGKDFSKISSFLDHKTSADCIEFYYKNHKSDFFKKAKKHRGVLKQEKSAPTMRYLMTSGKKRDEEMNAAASLDVLGAASAIVAHDKDMESVKNLSNRANDMKIRANDRIQVRSSSYDFEDERETEAADVLAGICASMSSEAISSCITSSVDHGDGNRDCKTSSEPRGIRRPPIAEVTQDVDDDTCSDESCGYVDPVDWTDNEKCSFLRAFSSYGKDFVMISRCVRTKSRDQCKVFFSKARKCLGLPMLCSGPGNQAIRAASDPEGGHSDTEDACVVENEPASCSDKSTDRTVETSPSPAANANQLNTLEVLPDNGSVLNEKVDTSERLLDRENGDVSVTSDCGEEPITVNEAAHEVEDAAETGTLLFDNALRFPAGEKNAGLGSVSFSYERHVNERVKRSASTNDLHQLLPCQTSSDLCDSLDLSIQTNTSPVLGGLQSSARLLDSRTETGVQPLQVYLKKCNRTAPSVHAIGELPLVSNSLSQTSDSGSRQQQCSTTGQSEKPGSNGGVKLFGKILSKPSTMEKPTSPKHAFSNGTLGPETFPVRSYGFWDGNRIQTGYPLPDSSLLLPKFPTVFSGSSLSEQQQSNPIKASLASIASSSGSNEYQRVYPTGSEVIQPYRLEVLQEDVFPEVPRKGYEAVSGLQQIKLSVVQSDVRAGLTDPVAALEQAWRGKNGGR